MQNVLLDSNIWDKLSEEEITRGCIRELEEDGRLRVLVPDTLSREMRDSPWGGIPDWFPTEEVGDAPFVLGYSRLGRTRLGEEDTFEAHRGDSNELEDAVLAGVARMDGAIFVSEDRRARHRFGEIAGEDSAWDYEDFRDHVLDLCDRGGGD